jgi:hypothetical protein
MRKDVVSLFTFEFCQLSLDEMREWLWILTLAFISLLLGKNILLSTELFICFGLFDICHWLWLERKSLYMLLTNDAITQKKNCYFFLTTKVTRCDTPMRSFFISSRQNFRFKLEGKKKFTLLFLLLNAMSQKEDIFVILDHQ